MNSINGSELTRNGADAEEPRHTTRPRRERPSRRASRSAATITARSSGWPSASGHSGAAPRAPGGSTGGCATPASLGLLTETGRRPEAQVGGRVARGAPGAPPPGNCRPVTESRRPGARPAADFAMCALGALLVSRVEDALLGGLRLLGIEGPAAAYSASGERRIRGPTGRRGGSARGRGRWLDGGRGAGDSRSSIGNATSISESPTSRTSYVMFLVGVA